MEEADPLKRFKRGENTTSNGYLMLKWTRHGKDAGYREGH